MRLRHEDRLCQRPEAMRCLPPTRRPTGQTIYVDGGRLALNYTVDVPEKKEEGS